MGRAAVGIEPLRVGIGAVADPFRMANPGLTQAVQAERGQVKAQFVALPGTKNRLFVGSSATNSSKNSIPTS